MRHWNGQKGLLYGMVFCVLVGSGALGSCTGDGSEQATISGTISLTAMNAAALGGLTFAFSNGSVFGFAGQPTTLTFGADGTTFTLTPSGSPPLIGTITFGSCTFTQTPVPPGPGPAPFVQTYDTCQVAGQSDSAIAFGASGHGTLALTLGTASSTPVTSDPLSVTYSVDTNGNILINTNTTPIGVVE